MVDDMACVVAAISFFERAKGSATSTDEDAEDISPLVSHACACLQIFN